MFNRENTYRDIATDTKLLPAIIIEDDDREGLISTAETVLSYHYRNPDEPMTAAQICAAKELIQQVAIPDAICFSQPDTAQDTIEKALVSARRMLSEHEMEQVQTTDSEHPEYICTSNVPTTEIATPEASIPISGNGAVYCSEGEPPYKQFLKQELRSRDLPKRIVDELIREYHIRFWNGAVYIFNPNQGSYQIFELAEFEQEVARRFGNDILQTGSVQIYKTSYEFLMKDARIQLWGDDVPNPSLWVFQNATVDVFAGQIYANTPDRFTIGSFNCFYNGDAVCPQFDRFIGNFCAHDEMRIARIWEVLGVIFAGDVRAKAFFLFVGPKDTGKSVLVALIEQIIGGARVAHLSLEGFSDKYELCELNGKRLNSCADLPDEPLSKSGVGKIKAYTGGDTVHAQRKFLPPVDFKPTAVLLFGSNTMISMRQEDAAFRDRLVAVQFSNPVSKENQNKQLLEVLFSEASGILLKAMRHYKLLVDRHYSFTECQMPPAENLNFDAVIRSFMAKHIIITGRESDMISCEDIHRKYKDFCMELQLETIDITRFSSKFSVLAGNGVSKKRCRIPGYENAVSVYFGLTLK